MEKDIILNGVHIGEHGFDPDRVIDEIYERAVKPGYNFVTIRPKLPGGAAIPQHYFIDWAKYLAEQKIYFNYLYTVQYPPKGRASAFDPETVAAMKEIAGEYYLGDMIGEPGSSNACKLQGYFRATANRGADPNAQITDAPDMSVAHKNYLNKVAGFIDTDKALGIPNILCVEATVLNKYNVEAGVNMPMAEIPNSDPDIQLPSLRGTAKAYGASLWGTYVAHEWYGGLRHEDILKRKRLELVYKYAYLAGSRVFCLESGDELVNAYSQEYTSDSEICADYRRSMDYITKLLREDQRPVGGPKVKLAFVSGLHDAWGSWGGSAVWNQFHREEWGHGEAEHAWRLLDELGVRRKWCDIANYGDNDLSAYPAYGQYDIVPVEAPLEVLRKYDRLIFLGWNTMTDENLDKLTEYVRGGGKVLMTLAHLNRNPQRKGNFLPPAPEKLEALFGCRLTGATLRTNCGTKFNYRSLDDTILLPGTRDFLCDPIYSAGYTEYAKVTLHGGSPAGFYADSFGNKPTDVYTVLENRVGSGIATLVTSLNYPGHPALYPMYRALVREWVTASARSCDIQVIGSERLRYAVYEGNKMYLLNTDYDMPITVKILSGEKEYTITLDSLEMKTLEV